MGWRQSYDCPLCNPDDFTISTFHDSIEELAQHRDIEHPGNPIYICSACDRTFNEWQEATEHVMEKHDEFCDECQRGYIYEAVFLSPEIKARISGIHDEIKVLRDEIDTLIKIPVPSSTEEATPP